MRKLTRAKKSDLVLDGNEVMLRLRAERQASKGLVHVDWVRFTTRLRNAPTPTVDDLFPVEAPVRDVGMSLDDWAKRKFDALQRSTRHQRMREALASMADPDFSVSAQAKTLADQVCNALGPDFSVYPEVRKGHDFYRFRWSIVRNEVECGWVGYLSSGESPRQQAQASTIHANVYGTACTFAKHGFANRLAGLIRQTDAVITRVDLALDLFDGIKGGMDRVMADYKAGLMDHFGNRPKSNCVGDWANGRARSFYIGSREAGKQTNCYEKGHQLFGPKDDSPWFRSELRYGNKQRVLGPEMLERPDDFFAGASDWHAALLLEAGATFAAKPVPVDAQLPVQTIAAEVKRNVRWLMDTASASLALAFQHLGTDAFMELVENKKLPGRLGKFSRNEVASVYERAFKNLSGSGYGRAGLQPSFAH